MGGLDVISYSFDPGVLVFFPRCIGTRLNVYGDPANTNYLNLHCSVEHYMIRGQTTLLRTVSLPFEDGAGLIILVSPLVLRVWTA